MEEEWQTYDNLVRTCTVNLNRSYRYQEVNHIYPDQVEHLSRLSGHAECAYGIKQIFVLACSGRKEDIGSAPEKRGNRDSLSYIPIKTYIVTPH